jgi:hypothetical protein
LLREEIKKEIINFIEFNENEDTSFPMKAALRGKFIAVSTFIKKLEKFHTSNLTAHLKPLEQKEANTPKRSRRQEIVKLKLLEKTEQYKESTNTTAFFFFFEKIQKIDKLLANLTKGYRNSIQIRKIKKKKGGITREPE